ncbi:HNH endonuclease [Catovirus CTV1]|uniref:HNH endonuclease n=1 Tax=Catovirus CTV1 TaxID=1977631 RepID=A0A1V0SBC0_9VIRU|nr:HNH endonuclease [Catovirus CTV1]
MKQHVRCGYKSLSLENCELKKKKTMCVHNLVANTFLKKPNNEIKYFINHKDGNKSNNNINNLEFVTPSENAKHAFANGLREIIGRKVIKLNKEGHIVEEYKSINYAAQKNNMSAKNMIKICSENKEYDNFKFEIKNTDTEKIIIDESNNSKKIPGFDNYLVTNDGKIYSKNIKKFMSLKKDNSGYIMVSCYNKDKRKDFLVHRLVAERFIPKIKNKNIVNHINKNKSDNRVENLEWVNESENMIHAFS